LGKKTQGGIMKSLFILGTLLSAQIIWAATSPGIRLGVPGYGGSGCLPGTASVVLSPDENEISVLFDNFIAEAGGDTRRTVDRKACDLGIPIYVPQGYSVSVVKTDFRGFNLVSRGGMNRLNTEYFLADKRGPVYSNIYRGPQNEDYFATNGVMITGDVWSACGASTTLRIRATIMTQTNRGQEQSMMTLDSADISSGLIYHIQWRQCR
jgi:hypothetical protein